MPTRILVVDDSSTIRKVVCALLERHGYEAVAAADGQLALDILLESVRGEGEHAASDFDIILLDFVMPRMNGFQFCRALRSHEELRAMPVILMSAKSDKIREQFVLQTGAIDAITKPFDAVALVAVIENAIRRSSTWKARAEAISAGIPEDFEVLETMRPPTVDLDSRRLRVAQEFVKKLAQSLAPALAKLPTGAIGDETQIVSELLSRLSSEALKDLAEGLRSIDLDPEMTGKLALSGDISIIPIGAVLQLLQIENQTGVLSVLAGNREVSIAMRKGLIDLVQSRGAGQEFRLGRYFVELGLVTPDQIDALLREKSGPFRALSSSGAHAAIALPAPAPVNAERTSSTPPPPATVREAARTPSEGARALTPSKTPSGGFARREESTAQRATRLLGDILVESGRVSRDQLKDALARQSSELTYEVLRWQTGRFEFRREPPPPLAESAQLGLPVASVVMEGFRRVDEWRLVEAGLGSFEAVLQRDPVALDALGVDRLARAEKLILDAVDGERTVREIVAASHMSSFDACKILFQLLEARLVRRRAS